MSNAEMIEKIAEGISSLSLPHQYYIAGLIEGKVSKDQNESQWEGNHGEIKNVGIFSE